MAESRVIRSRLPKLRKGFAESNTLWNYIDAKIQEVIARRGDKSLTIDACTSEEVTYGGFRRLVLKTAAIFQRKFEVNAGSSVLLCCKNSVYFPVPFYAGIAVGACVFSIPTYSHDNIPTYLLDEPAVPLIVCDIQLLLDIKAYVQAAANVKGNDWRHPSIVLLEGKDPEHDSLQELFAADYWDKAEPELPRNLDPNEACAVFLSSGSTGPPKPICHSHFNLLSPSYNTSRIFVEGADDPTLNRIRMFNVNQGHIGGYAIFFMALVEEATSIMFSDFRPELLLPTIQRYQVTDVGLYPKDAIFLSKVENWRDYDLSSVVGIGAGAAMFPPSIAGVLKAMFPNLARPIYQFYASTEMLFIASSVMTEASEAESGIGHLMPYVEGKVVCLETQESLGPNEPGEFWFRTPFLMQGYRNRPDLTEAAITEEGWYKSGDYGYYDEHERFHIVERVKDLIKLPSGRLVSPSTIDDVILRHNGVQQVGVAGIPCDSSEDACIPRAFVVRKRAADVSAADIVEFVKANAPEHLHLKGGAELVDGMVMSPGGKIYRMKLRQDYLSRVQSPKTN